MSYVVDENEYDEEEEEEEEEEELEDEELEEVEQPVYAKPSKAAKKTVPGDSKKRVKGKNKDPNRPRRNQSAFFLYCNEHRARVKANNPSIAFGDVARLLSEEFKALDTSERSKWDKLAEKDKARYEKQMTNYVVPEEYEDDGGGKKKKSKKDKDPNKPKRNQSAYFIFSNAVRSDVKAHYPQATFGELAKLISQQFKALTPKERTKWDKLAEDDKARYKSEMSNYDA